MDNKVPDRTPTQAVSYVYGNTEILITNLPKDKFKRKDIEKLYLLRWGIETSFNHLKNAINIEEFVGIKENSIKQEFYSILYKIQSYNAVYRRSKDSCILL